MKSGSQQVTQEEVRAAIARHGIMNGGKRNEGTTTTTTTTTMASEAAEWRTEPGCVPGNTFFAGGCEEMDLWVSRLVREKQEGDREEHTGSLIVQDLSQAVSKLMNDPLAKTLRSGLARCSSEQVSEFFERLILETEDAVAGEDRENFELRLRETATEHQTAFLRLAQCSGSGPQQRDYSVEVYKAFQCADAIFRRREFGAAARHFAHASFVAAARPPAATARHFSERSEEEEDDDDNDNDDNKEGSHSSSSSYRLVPFACVLLDLRMRQVESLHHSGQHKKAAAYAAHLLHWMATYREEAAPDEEEGYYARHSPDKYSLLQVWLGESECALGRPGRAIDGCSIAIRRHCKLQKASNQDQVQGGANPGQLDKTVFNVRQTFFEKMIEHYEADGGSEEEINEDRLAARILVNPNPGAERGYKDGKFIVHDLDSALRIAKDGDVIFLEAGTFTPKQPELSDATVYGESDAAAKKKKAAFEIKKGVTIVGCSTSKAIISGSLVKWGPGTVSFRRLKIEVGVDSDSVDDVYLLDGATELVNCVIESFVNTCFYVISSPTLLSGSTRLLFKHCILNGMDKCRRMICFQGSHPIINVESCYVSDLFSFITVISPNEVARGVITVIDSVLYDLQDGLKLVVHHNSGLSVHLIGCQFDMVQCDSDFPSHAFSMTGGCCLVQNNLIFSNHLDTVGLSLHSLRRAEVDLNLIEICGESPRALGLGEGLVLSENLMAMITATEIVGMRVGIKVSNQIEDNNQVIIRDTCFRSCALGFHVEKKSDASLERTNLDATLMQCQFDICHYGLLVEDARCKTDVISTSFYDVARPIMVAKANPFKMVLKENVFSLSKEFLDVSNTSGSETSGEEDRDDVASRLFLYFATKENLPHRMPLDLKKLIMVTSEDEQKAFQEKYHLFRVAVSGPEFE